MSKHIETAHLALFGRHFDRLYIAPAAHGQDEYLKITTQDGLSVVFVTEGECCSEMWFADILAAVTARGGQIVNLRELEMPEVDDGRSRQDYDLQYGLALYTTRGTVVIAYRNSSNGYYGGTLQGVQADAVPADLVWAAVESDDWSA